MVESAQVSKTHPKGYMLMFNISKAKNFGTIVRSAAAFNLSEIFLVEPPGRKNKISAFGSQGTATKMATRFFNTTQEVKTYCVEQGIKICGIEIMPESRPIQEQPFLGDTLFLLGNEGSGLNSTQIALCDHFVYIPQYSDKTASLNVAIAGSIVFQHFATWAQYPEASREGQKFDVTFVQPGSMPCILMNQEKVPKVNSDEVELDGIFTNEQSSEVVFEE